VIRKLVRRPSPATVIASVALFVSLSGVSYGVATGFIDSREIKNETIHNRDVLNSTLTTKDLRNNEIRGADVRNSTITGRDVALNTLGGQDIDETKLGDGVGFQAIAGAAGSPPPEFDVDPLGYVHLRGQAGGGMLPPGARPASERRFAVADGATGTTVLTVQPGGELVSTGPVSLDGVTFRAEQ
jgi:hypothetical protein